VPAIGGRNVERHTYESDVVLADLAHVFEIRRFQKRIDARPVRQLAALKATDLALVLNGVNTFEPELLPAADFFFPLRRGKRRLFLQCLHALQALEVGQCAIVFAMFGCVPVIESHVDSVPHCSPPERRDLHTPAHKKLRNYALDKPNALIHNFGGGIQRERYRIRHGTCQRFISVAVWI